MTSLIPDLAQRSINGYIFTVLSIATKPLSMAEIERRTPFARISVQHAIRRLIASKRVVSSGPHNARRYTVRKGATPPDDQRGTHGRQ